MKTVTYPLRWPLCLLLLLGFLSNYSGAYAAPSRPPVHLAGPTPPGNYVFRDDNQNNIFDAAEVGIANVQVNLYTSDGVLRETTLTTSTGQFSFTSTIQPTTSYDIRITGANAPANRKLVLANQGSDDFADSDASLIGNTAVIVTQSSPAGTLANNFGFGYAAGDPDLVLTNVSDSFSVTKGATATCNITVTNLGGSTATGVVIRDTLDPGVEYVSSSPTGTTALLASGQVQVTWVTGTIAAGATVNYSVTTRAIMDGVLSNVAAVTAASADGTPRNNTARTCFTVPVKLCAGDTYVTSLSANLTNVEWFREGVSVGTGNSLTIATAGTYSYTSTTVGSDCQASSCCPIIIYNGALPNLTVALTSTSICVGESTVLTATGCTGTLAWSTGAATVSITVSPTITTGYSVTCSPSAADACPASATATVTVNPSVTATLSSATICNGTTATLVATGGTSYRFSDGTVNNSGLLVISPTSTTPYSVTVTNIYGCTGVATGTITVNPTVTATVANSTICYGTSTTLTANASGGSGFTYAWSPAGTGATQSVTVSPLVTTPYTVTVTNSFGCSAIATATVTVNPAVTATVANQTICNGTTATLIATAAGGSGFTYAWSPVGTGSTQSVTVSPSATTTYTVVVTNSFGCSTTATATVTVNPSVTATLSSATICNGTTATLIATGGSSYTFSDGTVNTTGLLVISPSSTTAYSVTVTNSNGCIGTASGTVTVNPAVTATVANSTICYGTSTTLTANASGGSGFTYAWSPVGTGATQSVTVSPLVTTPYTVTVTNSFGCSAIATATVTVNPAVTATVADQTICNTTSTTLTANASGGTGFTYAWSPVGTGSTQSVTVSPSATTTYTVVVTNSFGCSTTATATVTVNPSVTATLSSATICNGTTATLIATGGSSYTFSDGTINGTGLLAVSPETTTPYSVTVANIYGCSAIATGTITVNPAVTATVASQTICYGTSTTLTANASGGTGFTYAWSPVGTGSTQSVVVSPLGTTPYSVTITNSNGCSVVATATVTVNPATSATIGVAPSQTICQGTTVQLTAAGTGGTSYSYLWSTAQITQAISVTPAITTVYSVTVSNTDTGCAAVASTTITVNPTPVLTVNSPTICQESSATLSLTGCAGTVTWSAGTTGALLEVTPFQTTSYTATCVLTTGCSATIATTVTVTPAPTVAPANVVATRATCNGATANNDASIALTGLQNTVRVSISAADGTTLPDFASATPVTGGTYTFTNLPNPTARVTYLIRLYGVDGICTSTVTVTLDPAACTCPAPGCVPIMIRKIR
ncbi:beta strand repeat-containing protein [uncultured Fibrella sp.]|uniref:beta strand repeat-containing protein n=1 Tax=uncultured Fibrella sp. TaxID=1284596 RepID=UPI0035CC2CAB